MFWSGIHKTGSLSTVDVNEVENDPVHVDLSSNNGEILINISNMEVDNAEINIYSVSGSNIFRGNIHSNTTELGDFEDGIYIVTVKINDSLFRGKVVVY